jgi:hypothetical protein
MLFSLILRPVLPLWMIFVIVCGITLAFSRQEQDQAMMTYWRELGFDVCELPCYAGIVPGETDFDEVTTLLAANLPALTTQLLVSNSQVGFSVEGNTLPDGRRIFLNGGVYYYQGYARDIRGSVDFPLYWALLRFGTPDCVAAGLVSNIGSIPTLYLYWQQADGFYWVGVALFEGRVRYNAQVFDIGSSVNRNSQMVCQSPVPISAWQGAAALWRYREAS